jgi:AraC-like DNA-binding protein
MPVVRPLKQETSMGRDTLSDLLRSVRLKGVMFFYVDCVEPWVTAAPDASVIAPVVMPDSEHLMEYHMVVRGDCWAAVAGQPRVQVHRGDVIVFPHGDAHMLSSAPDLRAEPDIDSLFEWRPPQLPFLLRQGMEREVVSTVADNASEQAGLLCGFLGCDRRPFNPLLATLPKMIHAPAADHESDTWSAQFVRLAVAESRDKRPGGEAVLERMSEMMFVDLLRRYLETLPEDDRSWLAGLRDRYVGRVLSLMHEFPAKAWTLERLSDCVGLSRSALHERFLQFIGIPPMQYLTRWRMQVASRLLTEGNATLAAVALDVGYESDAAFSRAFKRAVGVPPAVWRRRRAAPAGGYSPPLAEDRGGNGGAERSATA